MKIQRSATNVLERTSQYLKAGVLKEKPAWFNVVGANPPSTDLTKKPKKFELKDQEEDPRNSLFKKNEATGFYKTSPDKRDRSQKHNSISRVPKLKFLEDELRNVFYQQHPWELSRPKTLIETSGDEYKKCDWSRMLQLYKPLDGESVVQRTLWLLQDGKEKGTNISLFEAYDQARFEFYRHRMQEEMSSAVSKEESTLYGAVFASTNIGWGVKREQEHVDSWAKVASEKTKIRNANKDGKASSSIGMDDSATASLPMWESVFESSGQTVSDTSIYENDSK